ncbi:Pyridine nucleotide-disulphide oxidoreductase [Novosphingobium sp. B1]|nr:Pyridine nucleotide-disulphide oxidoreductase [Novosphingobium sp. B1]
MPARPHAVIIGGGLGGMAAARALGDAPVDVTVIDRRNHHQFQPLLNQVATAGPSPADIAGSIRSILREQISAGFLPAAGLLAGAVPEELAAHEREIDLRFQQLFGGDRQGIAVEHDQVGELAGFYAAFLCIVP